ncbi:MAG: DUF2523 family protein [Pseudomonadota bacterium]
MLLLVWSGVSWAYPSTQSWQVTPVGATPAIATPVASIAAALAGAAVAYPQYTWASCTVGASVNLYVTVNACSNPSYVATLLTSSCAAGDTLDAGGLTCTAAGGGGTTGGGTGYGGDSGTGFAAWLLSWLNAFTAWILTVIASVFVGLWAMLTDLFIFVLDSLFDLVLYIVSGMSWDFTTFNPVTYWNQLPADLVSVLNMIGVPIALGMIVAALGIRFILQLVPFVRWGS